MNEKFEEIAGIIAGAFVAIMLIIFIITCLRSFSRSAREDRIEREKYNNMVLSMCLELDKIPRIDNRGTVIECIK